MRQIHTCRYYNKTFYVGDITVEDYILFMKDSREGFFKILREFNTTIPRLNQYQQEKLVQFLFDIDDKDAQKARKMTDEQKKKHQEKNDSLLADLHIFVGFLCFHMNQQYSEVMKMPKYRFEKTLKDLSIISGHTAYDKDRNKPVASASELREKLGGNPVIYS